MSAFEYLALDNAGRRHKGVLEADSARQIRGQLRERGLTPLTVEEVQKREARAQAAFAFKRGVSATDLALITRQLATLVRSALPVEEALRVASQQNEKPRLRNMLMGVRGRVLEGHTLAHALGDFPHVFPPLFRATVAAGEQSGYLDVALERLADYTESHQQLRQRLSLALIYPSILTMVALVIVIGLLAYVVPQVVQVFENIGQELPLLTRGLIAVSDFMRDYGLALLVLFGIAGGVLAWMLRKPGPRRQWHRLLLRTPLVARLVRGLNTARFARTFSILLASGVPVLDALRIGAEVIGNMPMREAVEEAARKVREGASIYSALEKSRYFPPLTLHLIASGEASGNLEDMLERAATSQEREIEILVATLLGLFEPLLIVLMGGLVLIIVLAILLPIFDLNQLVR